eukprot:m51a1_g12802 hypothetical protein (211) ;mRNA; f:2548-3345
MGEPSRAASPSGRVVIRVYNEGNLYKSFAVGPATTAADVCRHYALKTSAATAAAPSPLPCFLWAYRGHSAGVRLDPAQKPLELLAKWEGELRDAGETRTLVRFRFLDGDGRSLLFTGDPEWAPAAPQQQEQQEQQQQQQRSPSPSPAPRKAPPGPAGGAVGPSPRELLESRAPGVLAEAFAKRARVGWRETWVVVDERRGTVACAGASSS